MAVDAILGTGSRLYYSTNSGVSYTELTDLVEMGPPEDGKADQVEATPLNPTGNAKEYLSGLVENGTFTFQQYWKKTRYAALKALVGTKVTWKVVFPDNATPSLASKLVFDGNLQKARPAGLKKNEPLVLECEVMVTGATTFTEGS